MTEKLGPVTPQEEAPSIYSLIKRTKTVIIDEDKNTKLHYASALGDEEQIKVELLDGHKIDPENYLGWTPLMMAVRNGNLEVVKFLISEGADTTKKNKFGSSVFLISITSGNIELVRLVLEHLLCGGVSRQSLQKILSPLALAILFEHADILEYLIKQCFDVNASTPLTGISPLMFAAAMSDHKAIQKLIAEGANPGACNYINATAQIILASKTRENGADNSNKNIPKQHPLPLIVVNQDPGPYLQLTPYPVAAAVNQAFRKSSNIVSPDYYFSADVSPITPFAFIPQHHQVFFPPEFSPSQFVSPMMGNNVYNPNELLNVTIHPESYYSPFSPHPQVCYTHQYV